MTCPLSSWPYQVSMKKQATELLWWCKPKHAVLKTNCEVSLTATKKRFSKTLNLKGSCTTVSLHWVASPVWVNTTHLSHVLAYASSEIVQCELLLLNTSYTSTMAPKRSKLYGNSGLVSMQCMAQCFGLVHFTEALIGKRGVTQSSSCFQLRSTLWPKQCRLQTSKYTVTVGSSACCCKWCTLLVPVSTTFSSLHHLAALQDMAGILHKLHHLAHVSWDQSLGWSQISKLICRQQDIVAKHNRCHMACAVQWISASGRLRRHQGLDRGLHACAYDLCSTCKEVQDRSKFQYFCISCVQHFKQSTCAILCWSPRRCCRGGCYWEIGCMPVGMWTTS